MYLDTRNKNFCYMLAAYPQSNRDRSLRHEMALSHERLMAKKRHMQMEVASARVFPEGPGESRARGRGPARDLDVVRTVLEVLDTSPCASSALCLTPQWTTHLPAAWGAAWEYDHPP